jgi:hypothetical protein
MPQLKRPIARFSSVSGRCSMPQLKRPVNRLRGRDASCCLASVVILILLASPVSVCWTFIPCNETEIPTVRQQKLQMRH